MKRNEISENAHKNAVEHGFWDVRKSNEHCLMLICTEVAELVEADRKSLVADKQKFNEWMLSGNPHEHIFGNAFEKWIKNALEDEFADIYIRLADLAGALGIDFDKMQPCRYCRKQVPTDSLIEETIIGRGRKTVWNSWKGIYENKACVTKERLKFCSGQCAANEQMSREG